MCVKNLVNDQLLLLDLFFENRREEIREENFITLFSCANNTKALVEWTCGNKVLHVLYLSLITYHPPLLLSEPIMLENS